MIFSYNTHANLIKVSSSCPHLIISQNSSKKDTRTKSTTFKLAKFHGKAYRQTYQSSAEQYSVGLWLIPERVGVKIILVGHRTLV